MTSKAEAVAILKRRLMMLETRIYTREQAGHMSSYDRAEAAAIRKLLGELAKYESQMETHD